ncbi:LysR substrate-binding domain-containing protein, partial [Acinetobacter baumannii]
RYGTPSEPRDLSSLPCIANPSSTGVKVWRLERGNKSVAVTVGGRFKANNPGVSRRLALLGEGIIVLDEVMASQDLAAG